MSTLLGEILICGIDPQWHKLREVTEIRLKKKGFAIEWKLSLMQMELLKSENKKGMCSPSALINVHTPYTELFTKYSSCWEWVGNIPDVGNPLISLMIPAATRTALVCRAMSLFSQLLTQKHNCSYSFQVCLNSTQSLQEDVMTTHIPGLQCSEVAPVCPGTSMNPPFFAGMNSEPQYESHNKYNLLDLAEKEITDDKVLIKLDKPQN